MAKGLSGWAWLVIILVALYILYPSMFTNILKSVTPTPGPSGGQCTLAPSITSAITDAGSPGTIVTTTNYYKLNGVYIGTTTPASSGTADILMSNTSYIAKVHSGFALACGANVLADSLWPSATSSMSIYTTAGNVVMTNGAGANALNETTAAAGGSYLWKIHQVGTNLKSTGQELIVLEISAPANVSSVSMTGATPTAVPTAYTRQLTNGYVAAWILPGITGNGVEDSYLALTAATNKIVNGYAYLSIWGVQPFVDTDGTFVAPGSTVSTSTGQVLTAFDSLNTAKNTTFQTYDFAIHA